MPGFGPGHLPENLDEVFITAEPGGIYGPIQTEYGYHVVEVISKTP